MPETGRFFLFFSRKKKFFPQDFDVKTQIRSHKYNYQKIKFHNIVMEVICSYPIYNLFIFLSFCNLYFQKNQIFSKKIINLINISIS